MVSEVQEAKMISERAARNKQDKKHPHLINVKDGRLLPNVPALAGYREAVVNGVLVPGKAMHRNYRVYTGDPKASAEERLKWLETSGSVKAGPRPVTLANVEPFDVGTATRDELLAFASSEYQEDLSQVGGLKALRTRVIELATRAGAVTDDPLG